MKARISVLVTMSLLGVGFFGPKVMAAEFSPNLKYELSKAQTTDFVSAIVILESPIDIRALDQRLHVEKATKARRHSEVLAALHYNAENTQPKIRAEFDQAIADGAMKGYTPYWIENLFVIQATKDFIDGLRGRGDIRYVTENFQAKLIDPIPVINRRGNNPLDTRTLAPGIQEVGALRVDEELGLDGTGVLVGDCDTGTDGNHVAFATRWRGLSAPWWQCWRDPLTGTQFPWDGPPYGNHGTHTMGTMCGRGVVGTDTTWVGCAPNARWMSDNVINQGVSSTFNNQVVDAYQWFTDPDTVNHSPAAVPDVINNSWGVNSSFPGYTQCFDFWNTVMLNCEAGGTVVVFAAGNEGPGASTLRSPAIYSMNDWQMFAVGAVDGTTNPTPPYPIADFSSRGPTPCVPANPNNIKPEISAPGVNVLSSVPGGTYQSDWSGTSMATPHVSGIVALMREACPNCDPQTIKEAIMSTAIRTGYVTPPATENNTFGNGFIDGYHAVLAVANLGRVGGLVQDVSSNPIAGVSVSNLNGSQSTLTDVTGHYYLPLSAGTYTIRFAKPTYVTQDFPGIVIVQGDTTVQNVTLLLTPIGTLSGTITNCTGGPAASATVSFPGSSYTAITTDANGHYSQTVDAGMYSVQADKYGCTYVRRDSNVVAGNQTVTVNLTLRAPTGLQGTITSCVGGPAVGAIVTFPSSILAACTTDVAGHYLRYSLGGTFTVHAASSNCSDIDSPGHVVAETQLVTVDLTLNPAGILRGTVTSCQGGPAVGATVTLVGTGRPPATTNAAGFYQFTGLPAATYTEATALAGCYPDTGNAVVTSGNTTTRDITLISNPAYICSPADGYGYTACEDVDPLGPVYNWRAIAPSEGGAGTIVSGLVDDNYVGPFTCPFTMKVYGTNYTSYYVGSNGYMTFPNGYSGIPYICIPQSGYPVGYYPFGCDMYPPGGGQVATYFDAANHLFILEFYQIRNYGTTSAETFEVVVYDPLYYPTATGDADVVFQYNTVPLPRSPYMCGIQNGTIGLNYECGAVLPQTTLGIAVNRAVRFSTGSGCQGSPSLVYSPASITKTVALNGTATDSVHICNNGVCPLNWSLAYHQITPTMIVLEVPPTASPNVPKDVAGGTVLAMASVDKTRVVDIGRGRNQLDNQGGPDTFGYRWKDSAEPNGPVFNWMEINSVGTNTGLHSDDHWVNIGLPFQFSFYGNVFSAVNVMANGNLQFGASPDSAYTNLTIPNTAAPHNMIAPFWDDLYGVTQGNIYYYNDVSNNRFIVEYDHIPYFAGTGDVTFEVMLYTDGHVIFQYLSITGATNSCTVGQQNATGTDGLQVVYNAAYITNNLAIQFSTTPPVQQWCSIVPPTGGQEQQNQCAWVYLNFNAGSLAGGQYTGTLTLTSNDLQHNPTTIPLTLIVGLMNPPQQLTVLYDPTASQFVLRWLVTGAPQYKVYSSTAADGQFNTLVGSSNSDSLTIPLNPASAKLFYEVVSWDGSVLESAPSRPVHFSNAN